MLVLIVDIVNRVESSKYTLAFVSSVDQDLELGVCVDMTYVAIFDIAVYKT